MSKVYALWFIAFTTCLFAGTAGANLKSGSSETAEISAIGEIDTYTFSANAGETVALMAGGVLSIPELRVFNAQNEQVAFSSGYAARIRYAIETSGTYTVTVADGSQRGNQTGSYELHFARLPSANEGGRLQSGTSVSETITKGDLDTYTLNVRAGEPILLMAAGTLSVPMLELYDPSGALLEVDWGYAARIWRKAPVDGTYTVLVWANPNAVHHVGDYELHYASAPGANEGGSIASGGVASGNIDIGDIDSYTVSVKSGDYLRFSASGSLTVPYLVVFDPEGQLFELDWGYTAQISKTASVDGDYTVIVWSNPNHTQGSGSYALSFTTSRNTFSYAAMGDSYSSGEGVRPYLDAKDNAFSFTGILSGCHRSALAYSQQLTLSDSRVPLSLRPDVDLDFVACSGATTENVTRLGTPKHGEPPQLDAQNAIDERRDLITVTIGGNDGQFPLIVGYCMAHNNCNALKPFDPWLDLTLGDLYEILWVPVVQARVEAVLREIREAAPNATILAMDYPILLGGAECDAVKVPLLDDAKLSVAEQQWMRGANAAVNDAVAAAAAAAGVYFASVENIFEGHGVCGPLDDWIFGLVPYDPKASFHPTLRGQMAYNQVASGYLEGLLSGVESQDNNLLVAANPEPEVTQSMQLANLGNLPEFGELSVRTVAPPSVCSPLEGVIVNAEPLEISGDGFAAGETVALSLVIANQTQSLGSVIADENGYVQTQIVPSFPHAAGTVGVIEALAGGTNGAGRLLLQSVRVEESLSVDTDGDGIPDGCDNCSILGNSDQADTNDDGIGDACGICPAEYDGAICYEQQPVDSRCDVVAGTRSIANAQWSMVSLPCQPPANQSTVNALFGDDINGVYGHDWIVFTYDPTVAPPASPYLNPGLNGSLQPGEGFWLQQFTGETVELDMPDGSSYVATSNTVNGSDCEAGLLCIARPLAGGELDDVVWNMVGVPFSADKLVSFNDIRLRSEAGECEQGCSLQTAINQGIAGPSMFGFERQSYFPGFSTDSFLPSWNGFWLGTVPSVAPGNWEIQWGGR